ncbi:Na(+)/H(+) antiporter subunit C [Rhodococcoides kroppenstedtii]|uniref:Na(+)/H(+) antiporter subunit C n=1 Tax=Rhodococcoides kroppenstedtii TaxID=293050 RepID=UPI001BDE0A4A|nr:Na(+)/H(+) antiporter subunit C [Rhodococcus kroppenstedtii]MBT1193460.1 Na(+)/H(+) antiporter subunit C [Rhodococcus kroppenstedtii]
MSANLAVLALVAVLIGTGVYLMIERSIVRMLLGLLLMSNGINLLILASGGPGGNPPVVGRISEVADGDADALAQALILTAIVITMGIAAFVLALAYRSYTINVADVVENDPEDTKVSQRRSPAEAPDRDKSDDPVTGEPGEAGDAFDKDGNPIPLDQIANREDLVAYEDLHEGRFRDDDDTTTTGGGRR